MLLRESTFLNSVLTNSEVWYGLTSSDIDLLEAVDKDLQRRIYKVPNSTPILGLYLESENWDTNQGQKSQLPSLSLETG